MHREFVGLLPPPTRFPAGTAPTRCPRTSDFWTAGPNH